MVDEFTSVVSLILVVSCLFSFYSLRTKNEARSARTETIAEYLFFVALIGILAIVLLLLLNVIK
jgi:hypothetical protein